jgi:hypothetical protein
VSLHRLDMLGVVADRQQAAMHQRMQRLDAAIHDFRKAGDLGNVGDRRARHRGSALCVPPVDSSRTPR